MKKYYHNSIDTAIDLIRPNATYTIVNRDIIEWKDPRPCPSREEIDLTLRAIRQLEDTINIIPLES